MPSIFLSYRRADSIAVTGRIYDRLVAAFSAKDVFKDVDNIPAGVDFRTVLEDALSKTDILLVIIGPQWASASFPDGSRRLDDPDDYTRLEVETGLTRPNVLVIPVLVNNAQMPRANELPPTMQELRYRNAIVVRNDPDFNRDMQQLIEVIKQNRKTNRLPLVLAGVVLLAAAVVTAVLLGTGALGGDSAASANTPAATTEVVAAASATAALTSTPALTAETTPEATQPVEPGAGAATPTPLQDGTRLELLYDGSSFYLYNPNRTRLSTVRSLAFEALDASGSPLPYRFEGSEWARFSPNIEPDWCAGLEISQAVRHLKPGVCQNYSAVRTPPTFTDTRVFWTAREGSAGFRVLWDGLEVARCALAGGRCDIRVPAG
jgi:hypothetical protein